MKDKRGVSGVVTAVLLILLVVASIGVLWGVVSKLVSDNAEVIGAGINSVDIDVQEAHIDNSNAYVKIKRMPATGNLTGVKFIFEDSDGDSASVIQAVSLKELEVKTLSIDYSAIEGVDFSKVIKISALPVVGTIGKNERVGNLGGEYIVGKGFVSDAGLVLYLPLDGSVEDKSENDFVVANNGAIPTAGEVFNEFTLSAWIYKDGNIGSYNRVLGKYKFGGGAIQQGFIIDVGDVSQNNTRCYIQDGTSTVHSLYYGINSIPKQEWYNLVCTYDSVNGNFSIYLDGKIVASKIDSVVGYNNNYPIRVGASGDSTPESVLKGKIDEVRIYNRDLSAEEISYLYKYG